ncbi:MAG: hypothetical protein RBU21_07675 [FCB group bacterium]|nr:hypothetical protein [FCB group bacterium]
MKRVLVLALVLPFILVACSNEPPPPDPAETPPPPPEPTVTEIAKEFSNPLGPIAELLKNGQAVPPEMSAQVFQQLKAVEAKFNGKKNLPGAKRECASAVEGVMKQAEAVEFWSGVMTAADLLAFFDPGNPSLGPSREHAYKELTRPRISKPSFITDKENNVTTVFLEVIFPDRGVTKNYQVREGEDFADGRFRLLKIIGRNQGVRILDVQDSKELDIMRRERE